MIFASNEGKPEVDLEVGDRLYLGLDFGTSGARFAPIDKGGTMIRARAWGSYVDAHVAIAPSPAAA